MAVWPFCLPWPRTSVTVMPGRLTRPSASFTSSTLLGRTMALISFISRLQRLMEIRSQRGDLRVDELGARLRHVKHVDGLLALRRNEHQIDVAAVARDHTAHAVQEAERVVGDQIENRVTPRRLVVGVNH